MKTIWIDIDNPPQVKYLSPFISVFTNMGYNVFTTVRDYGITYKLMDEESVNYNKIGGYFGKSKIKKLIGTFNRSFRLWRMLKPLKPMLLLSSSRSSTIAAYFLRIPSFTMCDYEHADLFFYKLFNSNIVFSDKIPVSTLINKGFKINRLLSFPGLKEQFSFYGKDINNSRILDFQTTDDICKVLIRPPSIDTHYYCQESNVVYKALLDYLSFQNNIKIIFYPRVNKQIQELSEYNFKYEPYIIQKGIDFLSLYKSIDLVISSGGTMLREAVFLNIPAYSIFMSKWGSVDIDLEKNGMLSYIKDKTDFENINFKIRNKILHFENKGNSIYELSERILKKANNVN